MHASSLPHLTLQRPDAHILLVKLLLLEPDPLHQIIDASVLSLQHQLTKKIAHTEHMFSVLSTFFYTVRVRVAAERYKKYSIE